MIHGNLEGIRDSVINEIEQLYDIEVEKNAFASSQLIQRLCHFTELLNREISVYINRKGKVTDISVGTNSTVSLAPIESRRGANKLCGIRCIHTHPSGEGILSSIDINSLYTLKLDAMCAVGVCNGKPTSMYCAVPIAKDGYLQEDHMVFGPYTDDFEAEEVIKAIFEVSKEISSIEIIENEQAEEVAILVGVERGNNEHDIQRTCQESLKELELLAETAGAVVVEKILQQRKTTDAAFYIGRGKAEELSLLRQAKGANLIIFDDELSGAQIRNLETITGARVVDRTLLILDIFARHAKSREGKIQVELAQLKYRLPRLSGLGVQLSRLGGGIGSRGPGEKKLEIDKRHIYRRVSYLESELAEVKKQRDLLRSQRAKNKIPVVALVGYTNSGKSTLMNSLSSAGVLAENKLFATLDPTARKITLANGQDIILVDTVGFIRKLPHHLVQAFKSTLEEAVFADVLVHVIDSNSHEHETQRKIVLSILENLGAKEKPMITAYNKTDLVGEDEIIPYPDELWIKISAKLNQNLDNLLDMVKDVLPEKFIEICGIIPYSSGNIISMLHENGKVVSEEYVNEGIKVKAFVSQEVYNKIRKYLQ